MEDDACDLLHIGSGWVGSSSELTTTENNNGNVNNEYKATTTHVRTGQGHRTMPYMRELKQWQAAVVHNDTARPQAAEICGSKPSVAKSRQSDFENLSLGPGCPWLEYMDFHI